ncbi:MAG TPA: extracellular solute-binding protein, partial [Thermomicrobiales bacterium]|nr:extracellular solute-binding protein [Thermomicrobiales bacterium]
MLATTTTRRTILKAGAAGLAGAALGAGPRAGRISARQEAVTLRWWDYYTQGANATAMEAQLRRFMEANPGVTVERTPVPFADLKQKLLQGAAAGQLPDVVVIDNPDHQAFAALGVLEDLTDRVAEWGQAEAYFEGPWNSTIWQERNYGIPDNSNCLVLWRNLALTQPAEVAAPTNWDELRAAAATLTEGDRMGLAVSAVKSEEGTFQWLPFLWETGEDI